MTWQTKCARVFFGAILTSLVFVNYAFSDTQYTLTVLCELPSFPHCSPNRVNDLGHIVGNCAATSTPGSNQRAFIWQNGVMTQLDHDAQYSMPFALDINNHGIIVGYAFLNSELRAILWSGGTFIDMNDLTLSGSNWILSAAHAINDDGHVVGVGELNGSSRAFRFADGIVTSLGTLGGDWSCAFGVNAIGQVVGSAETSSGEIHAFRWTSGVIHQLGPLPGNYSEAFSINETGVTVGIFGTETEGPGPFEPPRPFQDDNGTISELETADLDWVYAVSISNDGSIVGSGSRIGQVATLWNAGSLTELYEVSSPVLGWSDGLGSALDINNIGDIVGSARLDHGDGNLHAYLLTPQPPMIPAVSSWGLLVFAGTLLVLGTTLLQRRRVQSNPSPPNPSPTPTATSRCEGEKKVRQKVSWGACYSQ